MHSSARLANVPPIRAVHGRDRELERIGETLAATAAGRGGVLVLDGPAGIGRTRLLGEAVAMARRNGIRAVWGSARPGDAPMVLGPLLEALFGGPQPLLPAEVLRGLGTDPQHGYRLLQELRERIGRAAATQPLLIVVDDLQWADAATLAALERLPAGLVGAPVAWLLGARAGESPAALAPVLDALQQGGAHHLQIGALPAAAVAPMLEALLGDPAGPDLLELAGRAAGHPGLLADLTEGLREDGRLHRRAGVWHLRGEGPPARLRDSVRRRLDALAEETARMLRVAAILGRFRVDHLVRMLGTSASALLGPLDEALRADLLLDAGGLLRFRQDLVRETIVAALADSMRRSLERQAADVLLAARADPLAIAAHMAAGADRGDRTATRALRTAARSLAGADPGAAADLSRNALALTLEEDPSWGALVAETVVLLHAAMRSGEAASLAAVALDGRLEAEPEAGVLLSLSAVGLRSADERAAHNRRALELDGLSDAMRARHLAALAANVACAGRFAAAEPLVAPGWVAAREVGDDAALSAVVLADATLEEARGNHPRALELVQQGLRRSGSARRAEAVALGSARARLLATTGRLDAALELTAAGIARARRDRQLWALRHWNGCRGALLLEAGDLAGARAEGEAALAVTATADGQSDLHGVLVLGRVALHTGDVRRLRSSLLRAREVHERGTPIWRRQMAWLLALADFADGRPEAAVRWLRDDELPYAVPFGNVTHAPTAVRMALDAGRHPVAEAAVALAESHARHNPGNALLAGVAAHARGLAAGDAEDLLAAVRLLRRAGRPPALAAALEDAAAALAIARRRDEAAARAGEAFDLWQQAGATADASRVRRRLRGLGVHRSAARRTRARYGWDSLTDSELRVIRLVAEGHSNRQVAEQLVLSRHTVSTHLRHAFAKLAINSRVELARIVLDRELAAPPEPPVSATPPALARA
jgi:DNA-binding CsgD family transcriptional regulator